MLLSFALIVLGLAALAQGGDSLIDGATGLARRVGVSPLVIGLTVVAFGTSAPELAVSVLAALNGAPALAVGNVLGSNPFNLLVAVGLPAAIYGLTAPKLTLRRDVPVGALATALVWGLASTGDGLGRLEGALLVLALVVWVVFLLRGGRSGSAAEEELPDQLSESWGAVVMILITANLAIGLPQSSGAPGPLNHGLTMGAATLCVLNARRAGAGQRLDAQLLAVGLGLALLILGSKALVSGASTIALGLGISEAVVGLTVVAVGTSAPELTAGLLSARRGQAELAFGNAVGSNIFNLLGVLGLAAVLHPIPFETRFFTVDLPLNLGVALLPLVFLATGGRLSRPVGALMVLAWAGWTAWLVAEELGGA
ncbi:MAG: calcium/sodium antiporter [Deltaproteobacteria bacterium]|nr:calcium/sodium antiporter [Deltaproteobacteria bacterium]